MNHAAWNQWVQARNHYRREIEKLKGNMPLLQNIQQTLVNSRSPSYPVETPIVYNSAFDDINPDSDIRLILVADNPGRREQAAENRRYLVGPSGKIAAKFFRDNPSFHIDFSTNVVILNKTPIHSPRTVELRELCRLDTAASGGTGLEDSLYHSQRIMARLLKEFHHALSGERSVPVWICGYSEMKRGGIFAAYTDELKTLYRGDALQNTVFVYRHFSMNQFTIDLKRQAGAGEPVKKTLARIGAAYRKQFLW